MGIREHVRNADRPRPEADVLEHRRPFAVVPVGEGLVESHHEPVQGLGEEQAEAGLGGDVLDDQRASWDEQRPYPFEDPALVVAGQMVHDVEHVGRVEGPLEGGVADVSGDERVPVQTEALGDGAGDTDSTLVGVYAHDAPAPVHLPEIGGEQAEPAPHVEDSPLVGEEQVHHAEELRPHDREAHERIRALDRGQGPYDVGDRTAAVNFGGIVHRSGRPAVGAAVLRRCA